MSELPTLTLTLHYIHLTSTRWLGASNEQLPEAERFNLVVLGRWGEVS